MPNSNPSSGSGLMTETAVKQERQIKVSDRCDRCGAQAYVLVKLIAGELLFCGHHFNQHEKPLANVAFEIIDEREHI